MIKKIKKLVKEVIGIVRRIVDEEAEAMNRFYAEYE